MQGKQMTVIFEGNGSVTIKNKGSIPIITGISKHNIISVVFTKNINRYMHINVAQTTLEND